MVIFISWIIFSVAIGFAGSTRKIGFGAAFFLSILLSPVIGAIFVFISKPNEPDQVELVDEQISTDKDSVEKLKDALTLKEKGAISEEEYVSLKNEILNGK